MIVERSLQRKLAFFLVPKIIKWMLLLIGLTCRKKWIGLEYIDDLKKQDRNWIYSTWHNNNLFNALILKNQKLIALVSLSKDGNLGVDVLELMGNKTIRGSTSKGGAKALLSMRKEIKKGQNGAITPDGPRGPRYEMQSGAIWIAGKTGVPLVPFHIEATRQWIFEKSWDKLKLPKPFSTIVISVGKPYSIRPKLTREELDNARREFETVMLENVENTHTLVHETRKTK